MVSNSFANFFNGSSTVGGADTKFVHLLLLLHCDYDIMVVLCLPRRLPVCACPAQAGQHAGPIRENEVAALAGGLGGEGGVAGGLYPSGEVAIVAPPEIWLTGKREPNGVGEMFPNQLPATLTSAARSGPLDVIWPKPAVSVRQLGFASSQAGASEHPSNTERD